MQEPQETTFTTLRDNLCEEPLLRFHPDFTHHFTKPFILTTDASSYAIGGILSQGEIEKDRHIAYASRLLNNAEQNYATIEKKSSNYLLPPITLDYIYIAINLPYDFTR